MFNNWIKQAIAEIESYLKLDDNPIAQLTSAVELATDDQKEEINWLLVFLRRLHQGAKNLQLAHEQLEANQDEAGVSNIKHRFQSEVLPVLPLLRMEALIGKNPRFLMMVDKIQTLLVAASNQFMLFHDQVKDYYVENPHAASLVRRLERDCFEQFETLWQPGTGEFAKALQGQATIADAYQCSVTMEQLQREQETKEKEFAQQYARLNDFSLKEMLHTQALHHKIREQYNRGLIERSESSPYQDFDLLNIYYGQKLCDEKERGGDSSESHGAFSGTLVGYENFQELIPQISEREPGSALHIIFKIVQTLGPLRNFDAFYKMDFTQALIFHHAILMSAKEELKALKEQITNKDTIKPLLAASLAFVNSQIALVNNYLPKERLLDENMLMLIRNYLGVSDLNIKTMISTALRQDYPYQQPFVKLLRKFMLGRIDQGSFYSQLQQHIDHERENTPWYRYYNPWSAGMNYWRLQSLIKIQQRFRTLYKQEKVELLSEEKNTGAQIRDELRKKLNSLSTQLDSLSNKTRPIKKIETHVRKLLGEPCLLENGAKLNQSTLAFIADTELQTKQLEEELQYFTSPLGR